VQCSGAEARATSNGSHHKFKSHHKDGKHGKAAMQGRVPDDGCPSQPWCGRPVWLPSIGTARMSDGGAWGGRKPESKVVEAWERQNSHDAGKMDSTPLTASYSGPSCGFQSNRTGIGQRSTDWVLHANARDETAACRTNASRRTRQGAAIARGQFAAEPVAADGWLQGLASTRHSAVEAHT
jgi:hypothetical protein